ncbi:MAG: UDP-N-acetylmuramate dehydrogenase [Nitrospiria bacterium]
MKEALEEYPGETRWDESLAPYTSLKVGGRADALVFPGSVEMLMELMKGISKAGVPYFVLGNGTNVLVKEGGIRGLVLNLKNLNRIELIGFDVIFAEAGSAYPKVATFAMEHHLGGIEYAAGIPGTVGGAVAMNAGIPNCDTGSSLLNIGLVDEAGTLRDLSPQEIDFGYRSTSLPQGVVVSAAFRLTPTPEEEVEASLKAYLKTRRTRQPLDLSNCGSVFKNPPDGFAGDLIEQAGLKGCRVGDAQVSTKHGNFIVNLGSARADDVLALIEKMHEAIVARFGISLELEVKVVGSDK